MANLKSNLKTENSQKWLNSRTKLAKYVKYISLDYIKYWEGCVPFNKQLNENELKVGIRVIAFGGGGFQKTKLRIWRLDKIS